MAQGVLESRLPNAPWRTLVASLGYTVGFLIAVMARHQLFTENTITAVLPVAAEPSLRNLGRVGRLWGLVLTANLVGALLAALFFSFIPAISAELREAMLTISQQSVASSPTEIFARAIGAGFLIAAMVWLLPSAEGGQTGIIIIVTYLIAVCGFTHVVAGSFEGFMLMASGRRSVGLVILGFDLPALLGNIVGGTFLFSLLAYAQVAKEISPARGPVDER